MASQNLPQGTEPWCSTSTLSNRFLTTSKMSSFGSLNNVCNLVQSLAVYQMGHESARTVCEWNYRTSEEVVERYRVEASIWCKMDCASRDMPTSSVEIMERIDWFPVGKTHCRVTGFRCNRIATGKQAGHDYRFRGWSVTVIDVRALGDPIGCLGCDLGYDDLLYDWSFTDLLVELSRASERHQHVSLWS